jgi:hypothetical protein
MQIITGCGGGGGGSGTESDKVPAGTTTDAQGTTTDVREEDQEKVPPKYTKKNIAVNFMEASHTAISKLDTYVPIKAYKYKDRIPMAESDLSALKSKLNGYLGTKFAFAEDTKGTRDTSQGSYSYDRSSNHSNANVLFKNTESEDPQALKVNPYSRGFVFHRSQSKYLMPEMRPENGGGRTKAVLTRSNAPEFALAYLKKMDLIPKDQYSKLKVGKVSGIGIGGEDSPRIFTVYFIRELSGYPVVGNTRIVVSMAADGELVSLIHKWPELEETVGELDHGIVGTRVVKGSDAVDRIGDLLNNYHNETKVDSIDVRKTKVVMYDDGKHIEPVLFASGDVNTKSGDTIEYDWIIPLLKNPNGRYELGNGLSQDQPSNVDEAPVNDPIPDPENFDSGNVE